MMKKNCTFYLVEYAKNMEIGKAIMNKAFDYLGTKKTLITMEASKVQFFLHFMYRYD